MISSNRCVELAARKTEQRAVDPDVVARVQLRVEADAELDERREQAVDANAAAVGAVDAGEDLQQRALAAPVRADDAEELAAVDREGDVVQCVLRLVVTRWNGWRKCSLIVVRCSCGSRNVFETPTTSTAGVSYALREPRRLRRKIAEAENEDPEVMPIGMSRPADESNTSFAVIRFGARSS